MRTNAIFAFLAQKSAWIVRQSERAKKAAEQGGILCAAKDGASFLWLGERIKIVLLDCGNDTSSARIFTKFIGDTLYLPEDNATKRLTDFLKKRAKEYLTKQTEACAAEMRAVYKNVSVNGAKSRWGSCSYDNKLHFSFRLMYAPPGSGAVRSRSRACAYFRKKSFCEILGDCGTLRTGLQAKKSVFKGKRLLYGYILAAARRDDSRKKNLKIVLYRRKKGIMQSGGEKN